MRIFAFKSSIFLGEIIASALNTSLNQHEERDFEDGEFKVRPLISVRDDDVYVIQSLYSDENETVHDKLCKLLFFIATLRDAGAAKITAIIPYLCYARKDRRTQPRDPVSIRYLASLFESVRVDRVVTVDVHNLQAYQNAFRCITEHLEAQKIFKSYFQSIMQPSEEVVVMSPDIGGIKRAEKFRDLLSKYFSTPVHFAFMEKLRAKGIVSGEKIVGDVNGRQVIIFDDMISTGGTIARTAVACKNSGASHVYAVATHGIFSTKANEALSNKAIDKIVVTNTVQPGRLNESLASEKLTICNAGGLLAEVVRRLHSGGSLVSLLEE